MEKEIPLMALAYIERLLTKLGILVNHWNWRRIILTTLIVGSKVWDDDSLENVHFPKVMHDTSLKEINNLEKIFLEFIDFDLAIKGSDYAKYYFIIKSLSETEAEAGRFDLDPLPVEKIKKLSKSEKAEEVLREIYRKGGKDFSSSI